MSIENPERDAEAIDTDESLIGQLRWALARLEAECVWGPAVTVDVELLRKLVEAES